MGTWSCITIGVLVAFAVAVPAYGEAAAPASAPATQAASALVKAAKRADDYLTLEQIVQAYREKQYPLVIRETARVLANPKLAGTYDRFSVLVLRAESYLQARNFGPALEAFVAASKEAPNEDKRSVMAVTAYLIHHRTGSTYIPATTDRHGNQLVSAVAEPGPKPSIDLLDLSQREAAYRAAFWDRWHVMDRWSHKMRTFDELRGSIKSLNDLAMLEAVAGSQQTETNKIRERVALRAEPILAAAVNHRERQIKGVFEGARRPVTVRRQTGDPTRDGSQPEVEAKGLSEGEVKRLNDHMDFLGRIPATVDDIVGKLPVDRKVFDAVISKAAQLKKETRARLDSYSDGGLLR